jgi:hypothetical protein
MRDQINILRLIRDFAIIAILLTAINFLTGRDDLGWLELNPTPWLLLPALIGARYGVIAGSCSGIGSALGIAAVRAGFSYDVAHELLGDRPYFFTLLVLTGYLAGECQRLQRRENQRLETERKSLEFEVHRTTSELELARETRQQLEEHMALHNASLAGLDDDLRKLMVGPIEGLFDRMLGLLQQHVGLQSAGIYGRRGDDLICLAAINPTKPLAKRISLDSVPIARRALDEKRLISVKSAEECTALQPFLAALSFEDAQGEGVLLVHDMPLRQFDWPHLARMELIVGWTLLMLGTHDKIKGERKLIDNDFFQAALSCAISADQVHHVPSVILVADGKTPEQDLTQVLPPTTMLTRLVGQDRLIALLPFAGEMETNTILTQWKSLQPAPKVSRYVVTGQAKLDDLWPELTRPTRA